MSQSILTTCSSPFIQLALEKQGHASLAQHAAADLQLNGITYREAGKDSGCTTVDFSSSTLTRDQVRHAALAIYQTGTPYFLATIVTSTPEVMERNGRIIASVMNEPIGKGILGIHFEGPCIDVDCKGAHQEDIIRANPPSVALMERIYEACRPKKNGPSALALVTLSPNFEHSAEAIKWLADRKVAVSLGHFRANSWEQIDRAFEAGATGLTHVGNAWSKDPTDYGAKRLELHWMLNDPRSVPMVITDMLHCPPEFVGQTLRAAHTQLNSRGVQKRPIIVSDLSPLAGALEGTETQDIFHGLAKPAKVLMTDGQLLTSPLTGSYHSLGEQAMLLSAAGFPFLSSSQILESTKRNPFEFLFYNLDARGWMPDPRHLLRCAEFSVTDWQDYIADNDREGCRSKVLERHAIMARHGIESITIGEWLDAAQ